MREAIGGAILLKLVMIFIVIYVSILAIAINYSITFRVKNQIINLIEEYEGLDQAKPHIDDYIDSVAYYRANVGSVSIDDTCDKGYCIKELSSTRGKYYKVTTYVSFDFPILGEFMSFPVSGETKVIYKW